MEACFKRVRQLQFFTSFDAFQGQPHRHLDELLCDKKWSDVSIGVAFVRRGKVSVLPFRYDDTGGQAA